MCVFKKPSTPSFGVKLFVSLVLLAISLCLVNCTAATTTTTVLADEVKLTVPKTEVANKLTELVGPKGNKKFSEHNPEHDVKDAFPTGGAATALNPKYIDAATIGSGSTSTATSAKFEVLLPVDKTIDEYIAKVVEPLGKMTNKSLAEVKKTLKEELAKEAHKLVASKSVTFEVEKNFADLETILGDNFHIDSSSSELKPKSAPSTGTAGTGEHLFNAVFSGTTPTFDPIVYTDKVGAEELVSHCVDAANTNASTTPYKNADDALAKLLNGILGELKTTGATPVQWSKVVEQIEKIGFDSNKITESAITKFGKSMIVVASVIDPPSHYNKFYLKVKDLEKINGADDNVLFIKYLTANLGPDVKENSATAYPALVANTFNSSFADKKNLFTKATDNPAVDDGFHHVASADISKLIDKIDKALGEYSLLKFAEIDIVPATGPFTADASGNLVCEKFPVKHATPTATPTIDNFVEYVNFVLGKFPPATSSPATDDAAIKANFLKELWAQKTLDAYKNSLAAPITPTTPPVDSGKKESDNTTKSDTPQVIADGAGSQTASNLPDGSDDLQSEPDQQDQPPKEQQQQEGAQSSESKSDYMWIVWTSVSIVGTAIAGVVGYFFWSRKKASNL